MTEADHIKVLLVEDNPGDACLVQAMLSEGLHGAFAFTHVSRLSEATAKLTEAAFDIVLLDLSLPDSHGLPTLSVVKSTAPQIPVVVLTGLDDDETALAALHAGAEDYLVKGRGDGELVARAIRYSVERAAAAQTLRRSEARFRTIFESTALGMCVVSSPDGRVVKANPAMARMLDLAAEELEGQSFQGFTHPEDLGINTHFFQEILAGHCDHYRLEKRYVRKDGTTLWADLTVSRVFASPGEAPVLIGMVADITRRKTLEDRLRLSATVVENTREGVYVTDSECRIIHVNPAFSILTGYTPDEALGQNPRLMSSGRHDDIFYRAMWTALDRFGQWQGEIWNRRKNGEIYPQWLNISAIRDDKGGTSHFVAIFTDITSRKEEEQRLTFLATHDALTGLPNRTLFIERLERSLVRARRRGEIAAILFIDLDGFKAVNDTHGHPTGDLLLQTVAERLTSRVRQSDTVARLGGDEFIVLIEDARHVRDVTLVAENLIESLCRPSNLNGHDVAVSGSVGVSLYPRDGEDAETLIKHADAAMYRVKKQGRNGYEVFNASVVAESEERLVLSAALPVAINQGQLSLRFQPMVGQASGQFIGAGIRLCWIHPKLGRVSAARFMPLAKELGLIMTIGEWVLTTACAEAVAWCKRGHRQRIAIDVTADQLSHPNFLAIVAGVLTRTGIDPDLLTMSIDEYASPKDPNVLLKLRELGIHCAIKDVGAAQMPLEVLVQAGIDSLRLDLSFIRDLATAPAAAHRIVQVLSRAELFGLEVVGSGVESFEQVIWLRRHGCDNLLGYYLKRVLTAESFIEIAFDESEPAAIRTASA